MLPHFNRELDRLRGFGSEQELADRLGISADTLLRYRRGILPHSLRKLADFPTLLSALTRDSASLAMRKRAKKERDRRTTSD